MNYPSNILPNENLKIIECDVTNHHLIRYTPTKDIYDYVIEKIYDKAVCDPKSNMQELSASFLGVFLPEHIFIELTNEGLETYNSYCEPDYIIKIPPVFEKDFIYNNSRGYWFVQISKIQDQQVDYNIGDESFKAICKVCHSPMKWNYWHFSIRWYLLKEDCFWDKLNDKEKKKNWSDRLAHETRSIIRMFADIVEPNYYELESHCYTK